MSFQNGPFGPGSSGPGGPPPGGGWGPPAGGGHGGGGFGGPPGGGFGGPPGGGFGGPPGGGFGAPPGGGFGGGGFGPGGFGGYPPPPPKKSNTGLIIGIIIGVVFLLPILGGIVIFAVTRYASNASELSAPAPPAQPAQPGQPAQPAAPVGANGPAVTPAGYRLVRGVAFSYSVPSTWTNLDTAELGSALIESAQRNPIAVGQFMTNVNIAGEPFGGDGPAYAAANVIGLREAALIRSERAARNGSRAGWEVEAYWANTNGVPYVTLQRYLANGSKGYVLTCSTGAAVFATQRASCESILSSFRVD